MKRRLVALVLAAAVALGLAGCVEPGGPEARSWFLSQPGVTSVKSGYERDSLQEFPALTAKLKPTMSDAALTRLATAASKYLAAHKSQTIYVTLKLQKLTFELERDEPAAIIGEWIALHDDPRILTAAVSYDDAKATTKRADVVPVYTDYLAGLPMSVYEDASAPLAAQIGNDEPCHPSKAFLTFASAAIADPYVTATRFDACNGSYIAVASPSKLVAADSSLPTAVPLKTAVVYDPKPGNLFGYPVYSLSVSASSGARLALLQPLLAGDTLTGAILGDDGSLALTGNLPASATPVFTSPYRASAKSLSIQDGRVTIGATGIAGFDANYALATKLAALGTSTVVKITPSVITVNLLTNPGKDIDDFTKYGTQELAAIATTSLWHGRSVTVQSDAKDGVNFVNGKGAPEGSPDTGLGDVEQGDITYWNSLTH